MIEIPGNKFLKTRAKTPNYHTNELNWNQKFIFPVQIPEFTDHLKLQIFEENGKSDKDDFLLGSIGIKISDIEKKHKNAQWYNIYGAAFSNEKISKEQKNESD